MVDNSRKVEMVKQFLPFSDYIVVIDNGKYESGYITTDGRFSRRFIYDAELGIDSIHYPQCKISRWRYLVRNRLYRKGNHNS